MKTSYKWLASAAVLAAAGGFWYYQNRQLDQVAPVTPPKAAVNTAQTPSLAAKAKAMPLPQIAAPQSVIPVNEDAARVGASAEQALHDGYGAIEKMPESQEQKQVVDAFAKLKAGDKKAGAVISAFVSPEAFDAARWKDDAAYRNQWVQDIRPGRCFQTSLDQQAPELTLEGDYLKEALQGEVVGFQLKSAPHSPVTATSHDAAIFFTNKSSTQTVITDGSGIAIFEVMAPSGVLNDCNFTAASPMARTTKTFILHALLPEPVVSTVKK